MTMRNRKTETVEDGLEHNLDPGHLPEWARSRFVAWAIENGQISGPQVTLAVKAWQGALAAVSAHVPTICGLLLPGTEPTPGQRLFHPSPALISTTWLEAWADFVDIRGIPPTEVAGVSFGGYTTRTAVWVIEEGPGVRDSDTNRTTLWVDFPHKPLDLDPTGAVAVEIVYELLKNGEGDEGTWEVQSRFGLGVGWRYRDDLLVLLELLGRGHYG